jgi:hypothetical protein
MKAQAMLRRRALVAVGVGACLVFTTFAAWAVTGIAVEGSRPFTTPSSSSDHMLRGHLVLHGVRFDFTTGQLDEGSKALLDYAAEFLRGNPKVIVTVVQNREDDPNNACGLSHVQAQIIASYIEKRGVPAARLRLCQATPAGQNCGA